MTKPRWQRLADFLTSPAFGAALIVTAGLLLTVAGWMRIATGEVTHGAMLLLIGSAAVVFGVEPTDG